MAYEEKLAFEAQRWPTKLSKDLFLVLAFFEEKWPTIWKVPTLPLIRPWMQFINSLKLSVCQQYIVYNWSVTVSVMNAACYNNMVKHKLVHDFLVYEF